MDNDFNIQVMKMTKNDEGTSKILKKWDDDDKRNWFNQQTIQRSYLDDVVSRVEAMKFRFNVQQYGALTCSTDKYPLLIIRSNNWQQSKKSVLITGGVHGYETSGVMGALGFLESRAEYYSEQYNILVAPCVSPWGYETINRWNPEAIDPNRSFYLNSPAEESRFLMQKIAQVRNEMGNNFFAHFDLHETTDTDNSVFRPALSARDGIEQDEWSIPDGFYTVGDDENPVDDFQKAIIESVRKVTHIAPADENGRIIGELITQQGVINYPIKKLNLCAGISNSHYGTTTEVYPDSTNATDEDCIHAQIAAITGGLDYIMEG